MLSIMIPFDACVDILLGRRDGSTRRTDTLSRVSFCNASCTSASHADLMVAPSGGGPAFDNAAPAPAPAQARAPAPDACSAAPLPPFAACAAGAGVDAAAINLAPAAADGGEVDLGLMFGGAAAAAAGGKFGNPKPRLAAATPSEVFITSHKPSQASSTYSSGPWQRRRTVTSGIGITFWHIGGRSDLILYSKSPKARERASPPSTLPFITLPLIMVWSPTDVVGAAGSCHRQ